MNLTNGEKLIVALLCDFKNNPKGGEFDTKLIESALFSRNHWAIAWEYGDILGFDGDNIPEYVNEVADYLDMWDFIEASYSQLDTKDKAKINDKVKFSEENLVFSGFDGNNETEYMSAAKIFIDKLHLWQRFANRDLNSHAPSIARYSAMNRVFKPMIKNMNASRVLNAEELIEILNTR